MAQSLLPHLDGLIEQLRRPESRPCLQTANRQCQMAADALSALNAAVEGKGAEKVAVSIPATPDRRIMSVMVNLEFNRQRVMASKTWEGIELQGLIDNPTTLTEQIMAEVHNLLLRVPPST